MLKGGNTEAGQEMMANVNARLEQGLEQLKAKYDAQEELAERVAAANARQAEVNSALCAQACAEKERLNPTVDMTMEDPDVESLRQERLAALKARTAAAKRHLQDGGGDYREIVEDDFLKEVRGRRRRRRRRGGASVGSARGALEEAPTTCRARAPLFLETEPPARTPPPRPRRR
jgi:hypothetical protein